MSGFSLNAAVEQYVAWDPNPESREEMGAILKKNDESLLKPLVSSRLAFGTAGLRAPMGLGYACMNELVVLQTTQGLIHYLRDVLGEEEMQNRGVVIGYDHRKFKSHSSVRFAQMAAAVCLHAKVKVYFLDNLVPTPFVAFGVRHYNCAAGIMVTASHNPKADNGFKVYWGNGSQIIPPHDHGIAQSILQNLVPWSDHYRHEYVVALEERNPLLVFSTDELASSYFKDTARLLQKTVSLRGFPLVYTAMHGVGAPWIQRVFEHNGFDAPLPVPSQCTPDPEFPTVSFPNPEERGATNEAIRFAASVPGCHTIIANDPDADRLAVVELGSDGKWRQFLGNEIGAILGHYQIKLWKTAPERKRAAVLASVVSSRMLKYIAQAEGVMYADTLTGFKWLGNKAMELKHKHDIQPLFCYEEALGYCVQDVVFDKDGIITPCVLLELLGELWETRKREAGTISTTGLLGAHLKALYRQYGLFVSYNSYVLSYNPMVTDKVFARLRHEGQGEAATHGYLARVETPGGVVHATRIADVTTGFVWSSSTTSDTASVAEHDALAADMALPTTPDAHMIMYEFDNGCSITLRTSGTEPKIKFYSEMRATYPTTAQSEDQETVFQHELESRLSAFVELLLEQFLEPTSNGLKRV